MQPIRRMVLIGVVLLSAVGFVGWSTTTAHAYPYKDYVEPTDRLPTNTGPGPSNGEPDEGATKSVVHVADPSTGALEVRTIEIDQLQLLVWSGRLWMSRILGVGF